MTMSEAAVASRNEVGARSSIRRRLEENPFSWLLPVAILLGVFYLYPIFDVLRLAFTNASLRGGEERKVETRGVRQIGHRWAFLYVRGRISGGDSAKSPTWRISSAVPGGSAASIAASRESDAPPGSHGPTPATAGSVATR